MSIHKDSRSPYWHYNFQINGQRYYGSTKCKNKRDAMVLERSNVGAHSAACVACSARRCGSHKNDGK